MSDKKRQTRRRQSTFYPNARGRCSAIMSGGKTRCTQNTHKENLCTRHDNLRKKDIERRQTQMKKRGGQKSQKSQSPQMYEYDYYLDPEIEPFDSNASHVASKVWIGSIDSANDVDFLSKSGMKSIINASGMEPSVKTRNMYKKMGINYYTLSEIKRVPYKSYYRVSHYLGDEKFSRSGLTPRNFFKFMHKGVKMMNHKNFKFPVLINCHAGVNRSASLIASYLLTKRRPYTYEKTVEFLKKANQKRGIHVLTNDDFKRSLRYFPIFAGTRKNVSPGLLSKYNSYLKSYE